MDVTWVESLDDGVESLMRGETKLGVGQKTLGVNEFQSFTEALAKSKTCTDVVFANVDFEDETLVEMIADALAQNKRLRSLRISSGKLTDPGVKFIADALLNNTSLIELDLRKNQITDDGATALAEAIMARTENGYLLQILNLMHNKIEDTGAEVLMGLNVQTLRLAGNPFTPTRKKAIEASRPDVLQETQV